MQVQLKVFNDHKDEDFDEFAQVRNLSRHSES